MLLFVVYVVLNFPVFLAFPAFPAPVCSVVFISNPDTLSIKAGYSEYQGRIF